LGFCGLEAPQESPQESRQVYYLMTSFGELTGPDLNAGNAFDKPLNVAPVERKLEKPGDSFTDLVKPRSFTVLRLMNP